MEKCSNTGSLKEGKHIFELWLAGETVDGLRENSKYVCFEETNK